MRDLLLSVGYDRWILPVLLIVPVLAALIVWESGACIAKVLQRLMAHYWR